MDESRLASALVGPGRLWRSVAVLATTGSTNADLAAAARAGAASGTILVSSHQSAGRGRFDRVWEAPPGASVAVSMLLRPQELAEGAFALSRWPWLPLVTGLGVAEGLRRAAGVDAEVKWPNDVLIAGRKVCGILAEKVDDAAVVGVGINTLLTEEQLPVPTATSLALAGSTAATTDVLIGVLTALESAFYRWLSDEPLAPWYQGGCGSVGRQVRVQTSPTTSVVGLAEGVDAEGRLVVATPGGRRAFAAGDVHHLR